MKKYVITACIGAFLIYKGWLVTALALLVIIGIIATSHEFGHYIVSKAVGVRVDEFALGLGSTKLWKRKIGETEYSVRTIPLGAFVKPAGMDPEEEYEIDPGERSFARKGLLAKLAILVAGSVANVILTIVIVSSLYWLVGDRSSTIRVEKVMLGRPAAEAGIRRGDIFLSINGEKIADYIKGIDVIGRNAGKEIIISVKRPRDVDSADTEYDIIDVAVVPALCDDEVGRIGIRAAGHYIEEDFRPMTFVAAVSKGVTTSIEYVFKMYKLTLTMFQKAFLSLEVPEQIGGPARIASTIHDAVKDAVRPRDLLWLTAWLSMSIGVFNLLPIPALDGGRIFILLLDGFLRLLCLIIGKPVPKGQVISTRVEEYIHLLGFVFLIFMLVAVTWKDIKEIAYPQTVEEKLRQEEIRAGYDEPSVALEQTSTSPASP